MQPDLLSAQREDEQSESLSTQDRVPPEAISTPAIDQLKPVLAESIGTKPEVQAEKKRSKLNIAAIGLAFLITLVVFVSFAWVGYWAYTLNNELSTTQQQLAGLQAEHAKLQTDYAALTSKSEKLNTDLIQSRADLEKANTDLSSIQADLSTSKQNGEKLQTQIEEAGDLVEVLYATATSDEESDILKIDRLITESNNKELMKHWDTFTSSPSEDAFSAFLDYLILATRNSLK